MNDVDMQKLIMRYAKSVCSYVVSHLPAHLIPKFFNHQIQFDKPSQPGPFRLAGFGDVGDFSVSNHNPPVSRQGKRRVIVPGTCLSTSR
jgi:hypothetical protein